MQYHLHHMKMIHQPCKILAFKETFICQQNTNIFYNPQSCSCKNLIVNIRITHYLHKLLVKHSFSFKIRCNIPNQRIMGLKGLQHNITKYLSMWKTKSCTLTIEKIVTNIVIQNHVLLNIPLSVHKIKNSWAWLEGPFYGLISSSLGTMQLDPMCLARNINHTCLDKWGHFESNKDITTSLQHIYIYIYVLQWTTTGNGN
jgi:hypothetical protein